MRATQTALLWTANRGAAALQLTNQELRVAQREPRAFARKSEPKSSPGRATLLDMNFRQRVVEVSLS